MASQIYNWKRFWCPTASSFSLLDGGYLYDPDLEWGRIYNPNVVPFNLIADIPCLVLLGEPGIGKSTAIQQAFNQVVGLGESCLLFNLGEYQSEVTLCSAIFGNETFRTWLDGTHRLHLFLDSLDEGLLSINVLARILSRELEKYPCRRLQFRITCRTADWRISFEEKLKQLWGESNVGMYELVPLRRVDVIEAARANNLDSDVFLHELHNREAVPLAIKPVTLKFLLNVYCEEGQFPSTQERLYLEGCHQLCEETNLNRRDSGFVGTLTADQRMIIAARIAAVTVFANRTAIWIGLDQGDVPDTDITIRDLCGGMEDHNGNEFQVTEVTVHEVLSVTGLFSYRGPNRMGWAHQTYAEFLAAWHLKRHQMTLIQMMSLVVHPGDPDGKLVPQLHETAAWLAGMVPEVFREIIRADPEVLLRSDVATADVKDRVALVDNLLRLYDEEKLLDLDWDIRRQYRKLAHPNLAAQLKPFICDNTKGIVVRRVSIDIAEACELQALQDDLANIALDLSQQLPIRVQAAYAVGRIGDEKTKVKLKPLAAGDAGDDPDDELKGCGLQALWPNHITVEELFTFLTPPKQESFYGIYWIFLSRGFMQYIRLQDLVTALKWVAEQQPTHELRRPLEDLVNAIMLKAWENLEAPGVLEAFAKAVLSRLRRYEEIVASYFDEKFKSIISDDDEKRRRVLVVYHSGYEE